MEDVNISKYRASVVRDGSKPASPGFVVSEGQDPVNPPGTNNYVPYSGATANVELGEYGVEAGFITLDTTPTNTPADQGTIFWDADDETVDIILNGYTMKIGEDLFYPVKNQTGSTIAKGTAVRFNGTVGNSGRLLIAPFIANGSVASNRFMGVTAEEILNGEDGKVLYFGRIRGINTNAFNEGDILYASTTVAGGFQTAIPVAPNNIVLVAAVVTKSINQGTIFVRPTLASNLNTDEAVKITSVANLDLLQYQSGTGLWENKTLAQVIGSAYVPSTRTITINGTALDLSVDRSWSVGDMLLNTYQVVTGTKVFGTNRLIMEGEGTAQPTSLSNTQTSNSALASHNSFGFNDSNNIYFNKGTTANGGIFAFSNTATRTYTLKDASGTIAFTSDIPANPVGGTGTTNYLPKFTGSTTIGNSQIFDNGTGVGIGTTSPQTVSSGFTLTVGDGATQQQPYLALSRNSLGGFWAGIRWYDGNTIKSVIQEDSDFNLRFSTSNAERLRITSGGNLLVGTTSDNGARLQVSGQGTFTLNQNASTVVSITNSDNTNASSRAIYRASSGTVTSSFLSISTLGAFIGSETNHDLHLITNGNTRLQIAASTGAATFSSSVTATQGIFTGSAAERVRMTRTSVGSWDLAISATNRFSIYDVAGAEERISITSSGNVGIGTSSPSQKLVVQESGDAFIQIRNNSVGQNFFIGALNGEARLNNDNSTPITMWVNGSERMRITSGGNVLIGTTTDNGARLQVNGAIRSTVSSGGSVITSESTATNGEGQFVILGKNSSGTTRSASFKYDNSDLLRIGTSSPIDFRFETNDTERMRITSGGNVLIGTSTNGASKLRISGLPTSSAGLSSGDVWNDSGTLKIA